MSIIAITGTPGVGKTTIVELLSDANFTIISVKDLAKQYGCEGDFDEATQSMDIDIHRLAEQFETDSLGDTIVDGHLSHLLDVDAIIILRCKPTLLKERLAKRGYSKQKITANVEWEMIAGTWSELLEFELELPVLEVDATEIAASTLSAEILEWVQLGCPSDGVEALATEAIDWLG